MKLFTARRVVRYGFYFPVLFIGFGILLYALWNPEFNFWRKHAPVAVTVASPQAAHQTFTPDTLKEFIKELNPQVYDRLAGEIVNTTIAASKEYDLSAVLVLAVMATESEFDINAVSRTGAKGLMQIQPNYWSETLQKQEILLNPNDIHDPQQNIRAGCYLLRRFLDEQKSFESALSRYLGANSASYRSRVNYFLGEILYFAVQQEINAPYQAQLLQPAKPPQKPLEADSALKIPSLIPVPVSVP